MIQGHACVSVHCDQCGDSLGAPVCQAHFPTQDAALEVALEQGWRVGPGGRVYCSACGPVLTCEAQGHEFTPWRAMVPCEDDLTESGAPTGLVMAVVGRGYRYCRRCCLHESRRDAVAPDALSGAVA